MSGPVHGITWYIARDGKQYGPLSEAELSKFVELGHLKPTDLVWRPGFDQWRSAETVLTEAAASRPAAEHPSRKAAPTVERAPTEANAARRARSAGEAAVSAREGDHGSPPERRGAAPAMRAPELSAATPKLDLGQGRKPRAGRRTSLVVLLLLASIAVGGGLALFFRSEGFSPVATVAGWADPGSLAVPPLAGFADSEAEMDGAFQRAALWQLLKREFPEWYAARVRDAARMKGQAADDKAIAANLANAIAALRRERAGDALAAGMPKLRGVASTLADSLEQLGRHDAQACYGYIAQGETNVRVVELLRSPEYAPALQAQLVAIFEAISEGRRTPRVYPAAKRADYELLEQELVAKGWTRADLQLFNDTNALAQAKPEIVCRLVGQWLATQLAITDGERQLRLLVQSLRPVVAG